MNKPKQLKLYRNERIAILPHKKSSKGFRYAVTTHGRVISFITKPLEGSFLRQSNLGGYPGVSLRPDAREKSRNVHRLVAKKFVKQPSRQHKFVTHLNYDKSDNHYKNLKWVTLQQQHSHSRKNPKYAFEKRGNSKLSEKEVIEIKRLLYNGKQTTLRTIGKKFNVSDMQIHRIKTGENWSHVKP